MTNNNLTTEERYAYRRDIFTLLPDTDWTEFGQMGTAEYPSDSIFALMDWLQRQDTYTESEIFWIQAGSVAKGIDGAYAESYDGLLSRVFFYDPVSFIRNLTHDLDSEEDWRFHSVLGAAFDGVWYPQELAAARETLQRNVYSGGIGLVPPDATVSGSGRTGRLRRSSPFSIRTAIEKCPAFRPMS